MPAGVDELLFPPHPASPSMPAAERLAVATSSRPMSHGLPAFLLTRRMRRVKPRGNRIIAKNIPGRRVPPGPLRREATTVPVVPMVRLVVCAAADETVTLAGVKVQLTSDGNVPQERFTVPVNPPVGVIVMTVLPVEPLLISRNDGLALSV